MQINTFRKAVNHGFIKHIKVTVDVDHFKFGTIIKSRRRNTAYITHKNDFCVDESGMKTAIGAFVTIAKHADEYFEMVKE